MAQSDARRTCSPQNEPQSAKLTRDFKTDMFRVPPVDTPERSHPGIIVGHTVISSKAPSSAPPNIFTLLWRAQFLSLLPSASNCACFRGGEMVVINTARFISPTELPNIDALMRSLFANSLNWNPPFWCRCRSLQFLNKMILLKITTKWSKI